MILFTYDTPRPRPEFPLSPDSIGDVPELPQPLPEEEPGEWGDPIVVNVEDDSVEQPEHDYYPDGTPVEDEDKSGLEPVDDEPPGTLGDVAPEDPKDPLPADNTVESGIPVKNPSPDTTESPS